MDVSGHNLQKELKDVNNLWTWPSRALPGVVIENRQIDFDTWYFNANHLEGYYDRVNNMSFTLSSVTDMNRSVNNMASRFLNLKRGSYVLSYDAVTGRFYGPSSASRLAWYVDGKYMGSIKPSAYDINESLTHGKFQYDIPVDGVYLVCFFNSTIENTTLVDIRLKEGVI